MTKPQSYTLPAGSRVMWGEGWLPLPYAREFIPSEPRAIVGLLALRPGAVPDPGVAVVLHPDTAAAIYGDPRSEVPA